MYEDLCAHLQSLEEQLLQPATRANPEAVAVLLADDFREFGSSGREFNKPEILGALATEAPRQITMSGFRCQRLTPEAALVTYRSFNTIRTALRSSLWVLREGRWQMVFHQGTNIPD